MGTQAVDRLTGRRRGIGQSELAAAARSCSFASPTLESGMLRW